MFISISNKYNKNNHSKPFPKQHILDTPRLKEFADDNFIFHENSREFSKRIENTLEKQKLIVTSNFFFSHSVFKRLILQICKNQGFFGKGLNCYPFTKY